MSWITFRLDKHIGELCHTGWMRPRSSSAVSIQFSVRVADFGTAYLLVEQ
ncbi:hypothetical protein [Mycobacterium canetti]|nr:hypothetical protein [Mycobacterium canetti]